MSSFQYVPAHDEAFYQRCMEKYDSSTVISTTSSKPFSSRCYSATGFCPPPLPLPPATMPPRYSLRRRRERPAQSEPEPEAEPSEPPRKCARKTPNQTSRPPTRSRPTRPRRPPPAPNPNPIRLRFTRPLSPPPNPRTPAAEPGPTSASTITPNLGMPRPQRTPKVYFFRLPGGHWTHATNNSHQARLLRQRFRCASWLLGDNAPTTGGVEIRTGIVEQDRSWQRNVFHWNMELRPVDSVTERGGYFDRDVQ